MSEYLPYDEKELLLQIANGDEPAFKQLYDHYLPLLLPFLRKLTGAETAADEVMRSITDNHTGEFVAKRTIAPALRIEI